MISVDGMQPDDVTAAETHHLKLPDHPELRSSFMVQGGSFARSKDPGIIDMRQIVPTLARMLHVAPPGHQAGARQIRALTQQIPTNFEVQRYFPEEVFSVPCRWPLPQCRCALPLAGQACLHNPLRSITPNGSKWRSEPAVTGTPTPMLRCPLQLGPDTGSSDWDHCSGYNESDSSILGFSHTHLSGTGVGDMMDILLMPAMKNFKFDPKSKPDSSVS
jgi:hypothetical protein